MALVSIAFTAKIRAIASLQTFKDEPLYLVFFWQSLLKVELDCRYSQIGQTINGVMQGTVTAVYQ